MYLRSRARGLIVLVAVIGAAVVVACGNENPPPADVPGAVEPSSTSANAEDIPVEALPDPLPAPYLFEDEITVEQAPVTETTYVVQPGDSLATIAARFCVTFEEIQRLNTIVDINTLDIGDELRIPIREGGCGAAAPQNADSAEPDDPPEQPPGEIYIVQAGDTLADIAFAHGFTWDALMSYNRLTETQAGNLQIGQALIIPPQSDEAVPEQQQTEALPPPG